MFWLYNARTGQQMAAIKPERDATEPVFSSNSQRFAWADSGGKVHLHDAATGKQVRSFPLKTGEKDCEYLLFSPDGQYLFVRSGELGVGMFQVSRGRELRSFSVLPDPEQPAASFYCLACSPDNRLLAVGELGSDRSAAASGPVYLIEQTSGQVRAKLVGHRRGGLRGLAFTPDGKTLASGGYDNLVYLWDVTGTRTVAGEETRASETNLRTWWADLASADGQRAGIALTALIHTANPGVPFLAGKLHPVQAPDPRRVSRLLADLDATEFRNREEASRALTGYGELVEGALRKALDAKPPLEVKRRLRELLGKIERGQPAPETLRDLRAVEVLEHIGTPEARRLLQDLARGAAEARLTREAKATLERLARR